MGHRATLTITLRGSSRFSLLLLLQKQSSKLMRLQRHVRAKRRRRQLETACGEADQLSL